MTDVETVARAIMIAKGGACDVTEWAEREWNPAVMEAWDAATAALAAATPLIEARVREECAQVAENCSFGVDIAEWLVMTKKDMTARACNEVAAAIRKGRP